MTRKNWITAAAVLIATLLVLAVVVALTSRDEETTQSAPTPEASSPPATPSTTAAQPGRVISDLVGRQVTVVDARGGRPLEQSGEPMAFPAGTEAVGAPDGLALQQVPSGVTLMVSTSDGPTDTEQEVMTGYAQSPAGAAVLTANYIGLGIELGPVYADFLDRYARDLVAEDPAFIDEIRARGQDNDGRALQAAEGFLAPRWFRISNCSPEFCTVDAAMPSVAEATGRVDTNDISDTAHPVVRVSMAWDDGGWQILSGRSLTPVEEVDGSWVAWN